MIILSLFIRVLTWNRQRRNFEGCPGTVHFLSFCSLTIPHPISVGDGLPYPAFCFSTVECLHSRDSNAASTTRLIHGESVRISGSDSIPQHCVMHPFPPGKTTKPVWSVRLLHGIGKEPFRRQKKQESS